MFTAAVPEQNNPPALRYHARRGFFLSFYIFSFILAPADTPISPYASAWSTSTNPCVFKTSTW
jgi:hypothetical protein